jgi:hypothetical protein
VPKIRGVLTVDEEVIYRLFILFKKAIPIREDSPSIYDIPPEAHPAGPLSFL